jgi:hypothetical protein
VEFFRAVHGPLMHIALHRAGVPGVFAGGDPHPVAAASHPSFHGPDGRERSSGWGRAGCQAVRANERERTSAYSLP